MLASVASEWDSRPVRSGRRSGAGFWSVAIAVLALVPFAVAAGGDRKVESHKFTASPNNSTTDLVKCEQGSQVSGGGHSMTPSAGNDIPTRIKALFPVGSQKWYVTVDNLQATARAAESFVVCRKGNKLESVPKDEPINGGVDQFPSVTAKCPKGAQVTGGGGATTGTYNEAFILDSRPRGERGWYVRTFVSATHVGEHEAFAICDPVKDHEYETAKKTSSTVDARRAERGTVQQVTAEAKCPRGSETTGGGFATALAQNDANQAVIDNRPVRDRTWLGRVRTYHAEYGFSAYARCLLG
jgi:hypothetical protein